MKRLNFTFESTKLNGVETPAATAYIELTEKQFANFFQMREIAEKNNLTAVELFVNGVKWTAATSPPIETGEFIIDRRMGVALKAFPSGSRGRSSQSGWFDWGTLDLLYLLSDSTELAEAQESKPTSRQKASADCKLEVRNDLQLV